MSETITTDTSYFTGPLPFRMTNDYLFKVLLQTNTTVLKAIICSFTQLKLEDIKEIIVTNPVLLGRLLNAATKKHQSI